MLSRSVIASRMSEFLSRFVPDLADDKTRLSQVALLLPLALPKGNGEAIIPKEPVCTLVSSHNRTAVVAGSQDGVVLRPQGEVSSTGIQLVIARISFLTKHFCAARYRRIHVDLPVSYRHAAFRRCCDAHRRHGRDYQPLAGTREELCLMFRAEP
jgi:hypothetical protein